MLKVCELQGWKLRQYIPWIMVGTARNTLCHFTGAAHNPARDSYLPWSSSSWVPMLMSRTGVCLVSQYFTWVSAHCLDIGNQFSFSSKWNLILAPLPCTCVGTIWGSLNSPARAREVCCRVSDPPLYPFINLSCNFVLKSMRFGFTQNPGFKSWDCFFIRWVILSKFLCSLASVFSSTKWG